MTKSDTTVTLDDISHELICRAIHGLQFTNDSCYQTIPVGQVDLRVIVWHTSPARTEVMLLAYMGDNRVNLGPIRHRLVLTTPDGTTLLGKADEYPKLLSHAICFPAQEVDFTIRASAAPSPP